MRATYLADAVETPRVRDLVDREVFALDVAGLTASCKRGTIVMKETDHTRPRRFLSRGDSLMSATGSPYNYNERRDDRPSSERLSRCFVRREREFQELLFGVEG